MQTVTTVKQINSYKNNVRKHDHYPHFAHEKINYQSTLTLLLHPEYRIEIQSLLLIC